jgi:hypothetical protein
MAGIDDREIKSSFDWFVQLLGEEEWKKRKQRAMSFYDEIRREPSYSTIQKSFIPTSDISGWYLYLVFCYLYDTSRYDLPQGGRVVPLFKRIGRDINGIKKIKGIEERLRRALSVASQEIDSCLFEILVANVYMRNGWNDIAFLPEKPPHKTADILAKKKGSELYIECKRKSKISDYSVEEKRRWLALFKPVSSFLKEKRKSIILDITFHEELCKLPSDYLEKVLLPKISLSIPGVLIDNEICTIRAREVYLQRLKEHLEKYSVRLDGPLLPHLLFGYGEFYKGITYGIYTKPHPIQPNYIDEVEWGYAAIWHCDSEKAIFKKARSIKDQFSSAIDQLPKGLPSSVHFGIEVYDGELVEALRFKRIISDLYNFDAKGKDAQYLYFHMLAFTVPPDANWDVHEDCIFFRKPGATPDYLLEDQFLLADEEL